MILSHQSIARRVRENSLVIVPFRERAVAHGMTYGLGPSGYDIRVRVPDSYLDVPGPSTNFDLVRAPDGVRELRLHPQGFVLLSAVEYLELPNDLIVLVKDKSSWARRGLAVQNTIGESGWRGTLTLEISNHSSDVITIRDENPIAQLVFMRLDEPTEAPYRGRYQDQPAIAMPATLATEGAL